MSAAFCFLSHWLLSLLENEAGTRMRGRGYEGDTGGAWCPGESLGREVDISWGNVVASSGSPFPSGTALLPLSFLTLENALISISSGSSL